MKGDGQMERDQLEIEEGQTAPTQERAGGKGLYFPDHVTHERKPTLNREMGQRLINRAEKIMRQYPWVVLAMGAGLGYLASRGRRLS